MVEAVAVGVPPTTEDFSVHGEVIGDDVEVPGCGELVEGFVDPAFAECLGSGAVVGVLEAVGGGQLGGVTFVAFA
ncbi:MAG: hypothetical protein M5T61_20605 [Acidimicrobiia bacterium]|nr:hypothetical protein [Acidimicrobiia bacterium]